MPRVSVIIPSYNRRAFLAECIPSVQAQTFDDFELLVVDDDSRDGTKELVDSIAADDARVRYILREGAPTGTGAAARNAGIRESCGEYPAFLDSDDLWLPEKLQRQVEVLDGHADIGVVYCAAYLRDDGEDGRWLPDREQPAPAVREATFYEDLIYANVVTGTEGNEVVDLSVVPDEAAAIDDDVASDAGVRRHDAPHAEQGALTEFRRGRDSGQRVHDGGETQSLIEGPPHRVTPVT